MKLTAAFLVALTVATATASVSAQTLESAVAPQPRMTLKPALNLNDPGWPIASDSHLRARPGVAPLPSPKAQKRSIWPTVAGVVIGGAAGFYSGMGILLSDEPCQPNCGPRVRAGFGVMIGGPIVGGLIGHAIGKMR